MDEINRETKLDTRRVIKISRIKFIVILIVVIIGVFVWYSSTKILQTGQMEYAPTQSVSDSGLESTKSSSNLRYPEYQQSTIADTREFLKTSFSATIKTRDVSDVVTEVKNIIKGADGRIDNFYSSEKSGQISFVVAKSKFEALKDEIEAITYNKLYAESISSQNLLTQKQGIEEQTGNIVNTLDNLTKQKKDLAAKHTLAVNSINSELSRIQTELAIVRANISNSTDSQVIVSLRNQETSLANQDVIQRQKLNTENNSYSTQKQNLDNLIENYNGSLTDVNKQDSQFMDNIETVNGSIYINWVSLWEIATIFSPISPIIIIIILIILVWIYLRHVGYIPRVEWQ